ncbi:MAG: hypothetical protein R2864_13010 [Syntrophotaleaceae bacterium]
MKHKTFQALLLLLCCSLASGAGEAYAGFFKGASLQLGSGYRSGELDWNIAGDSSGGNPDVLSELEWEDLDIFQTEASARIWVGSSRIPDLALCLKGSAAYGWVLDGDNRDSDYAGNNRTLEFSRSENSGDGGNTLDLSCAIGPQWGFRQQQFTIALLAGWSYHEQNLELSDGEQTIALDPSDLGPIPGLDSSYATKWWGPWLGTDLSWQLTDQMTLDGSFAWHFVEYEAEADWNLRSDLAHPTSFRHDAHGRGLTLDLALQYLLTDAWLVSLSYAYQDWQAKDGDSWTYAAGGSSSRTQLNEVNWSSHAVMLGLGYRF